jgi:hypothetical protein
LALEALTLEALGLEALTLEALGLEALGLAGNFRAAVAPFAGFFDPDRTEAFFARWVRMIFAMKRIY